MSRTSELAENSLAVVRQANAALDDLFDLRLEFTTRDYTTNGDLDRMDAIISKLGAGMDLFKRYLQAVHRKAREGGTK